MDDDRYRDERRRDRDDDRESERGSRRSRDRSHSWERRRDDRHDDERDRTRHRDDDRSRDEQRHRRRSRSRSRTRSPRPRRYSTSSRDRDRPLDRADRSYRPDRDHDRDRDRDRDRRGMSPTRLDRRSHPGTGFHRADGAGGPMNASHEEAEAHARVSKRENRLYVGNLSYDCTYRDLADFMIGAGGNVVFSEVLVTPAGASKGCGIVEFETTDEARHAKAELADKQFMGRSVFIREDREETARFGAPPIPGKMGMARGEARSFLGGQAQAIGTRNLFVGNLPLQASWQDLKDLMRQAGEVIRADVGVSPDGRPKGNGTVVFADPEAARGAIQMFNGFDWYGSVLEVREDRFANMPFRGRGGFRGGAFPVRGGAFGARGGFRGGFGGGFGAGANAAPVGYGAGNGNGFGGGGYGNNFGAGAVAPVPAVAPAPAKSGLKPLSAEPNEQILVRNLPWSTANEDLVELFETVGNVALAEILYEGEQSKGEGIVQFTETAEAQQAGERFMGYMYGGRPLDVQFNPQWHSFGGSAARGGQGEELAA
ncbi:g-strand binding protein [Vanrija albida]|uniref:G-strand binding protein n=1 Tax=Vanrija albida TaxID=181172 RepID=A0ABR3QD10_9TREE